jgi:hypothetical protein
LFNPVVTIQIPLGGVCCSMRFCKCAHYQVLQLLAGVHQVLQIARWYRCFIIVEKEKDVLWCWSFNSRVSW